MYITEIKLYYFVGGFGAGGRRSPLEAQSHGPTYSKTNLPYRDR